MKEGRGGRRGKRVKDEGCPLGKNKKNNQAKSKWYRYLLDK